MNAYSRDILIGGVVGPSSDKVVAAGQDKLPNKSRIPVGRGESKSVLLRTCIGACCWMLLLFLLFFLHRHACVHASKLLQCQVASIPWSTKSWQCYFWVTSLAM